MAQLILVVLLAVFVDQIATTDITCTICGCDGCTIGNPGGEVDLILNSTLFVTNTTCQQLEAQLGDVEDPLSILFCDQELWDLVIDPCECQNEAGDRIIPQQLTAEPTAEGSSPGNIFDGGSDNSTSDPTEESSDPPISFVPSILPSASSQPSTEPSSVLSDQPSCIPSDIPSQSSQPTAIPSLVPSLSLSPSGQPSLEPSLMPTDIPTSAPSPRPTPIPGVPFSLRFGQITMVLRNVGSLNSEARAIWASETKAFYEEVVNDGSVNITRRLQGRAISNFTTTIELEKELVAQGTNTLTYSQRVAYLKLSHDVAVDPWELVVEPLQQREANQKYIAALRSSNAAFSPLNRVNPPELAAPFIATVLESQNGNDDGLGAGAIAGIAVGAGICICLGCLLIWISMRDQKDENYVDNEEYRRDDPPGGYDLSHVDESVNDADPIKFQDSDNIYQYSLKPNVRELGRLEEGNEDYDEDDNDAFDDGLVPSIPGTALSREGDSYSGSEELFDEDEEGEEGDSDSYSDDYDEEDDNNGANSGDWGDHADDGGAGSGDWGTDDDEDDGPSERLLDIEVPPGRLGVVLDTPVIHGPPVVHDVQESSPVAHLIQVGDKLIAVDDIDVTNDSATEVSKMIGERAANPRKLTVMRNMDVNTEEPVDLLY